LPSGLKFEIAGTDSDQMRVIEKVYIIMMYM